MKTITEKVSGILVVTEDTTYHHISASEITVSENRVARLYGTVGHKLKVEKNATVYLHGRCEGEIVNNGGIIYIFLPSGIVNCLQQEVANK